jgi:ubiquinone/menaquinone biosynthesis C-methylase UbiE
VRRPEFIARQSRCPSGILGRLIGHVMSLETAEANDEVLRLLGLGEGDRVLEVGFGHGRTVERAAARVGAGIVVGVDASEEMVRMARQRCRHLIDAGRVRLELADGGSLPYADRSFDKAYTVHTIYFWDDPARHLRELRRVLRDGGRLVLGFHAKEEAVAASFPASVYSFPAVDDVRMLLERAAFVEVDAARSAGGVTLASGQRAGA